MLKLQDKQPGNRTETETHLLRLVAKSKAMTIQEGRDKFIQSWGALGTSWGINRTMAQIHALLLISPEPLCAEEIMEALQISRGNANMNLRALMDWGLVN